MALRQDRSSATLLVPDLTSGSQPLWREPPVVHCSAGSQVVRPTREAAAEAEARPRRGGRRCDTVGARFRAHQKTPSERSDALAAWRVDRIERRFVGSTGAPRLGVPLAELAPLESRLYGG